MYHQYFIFDSFKSIMKHLKTLSFTITFFQQIFDKVFKLKNLLLKQYISTQN